MAFLQPLNLFSHPPDTDLNTRQCTHSPPPASTHTHTHFSQVNKSKELYFGYTNIYILPLQPALISLNASSDICPVHLLLFPPGRPWRAAGSSLGIRGRDDPVSPALIRTEPSLLYPSNGQAQVGVLDSYLSCSTCTLCLMQAQNIPFFNAVYLLLGFIHFLRVCRT